MADDDMVNDDELASELGAGLRKLLESERAAAQLAQAERAGELRLRIATAASELEDDDLLARSYDAYVAALAEDARPRNRAQDSRLFMEYENSRRSGLETWRRELASLETRQVDDQWVVDRAGQKVQYLLRREALALDLDPYVDIDDARAQSRADGDVAGWRALGSLDEMPGRPVAVRFPDGLEVEVSSGQALYREVVEWLIRAGRLTEERVDDRLKRCLRYDSKSSKELSNGWWLYTNLKRDKALENCRLFLSVCGEDAARFHVLFS